MKLRRLSTRAAGFDRKLAALTRYDAAQDPAVQKTVRKILADAIVDLVATGSTLKANDLVAVEEIMPVSARLIVNQAALKTRRAELQPLIEAFARAVRR